jgi:hypothetical protein
VTFGVVCVSIGGILGGGGGGNPAAGLALAVLVQRGRNAGDRAGAGALAAGIAGLSGAP